MERKKLPGQTCTRFIFSVFFRNSFITSFILFMFNSCDMFNSAILHNVFQSSMHVLSIRYRNDLNLEMLFHYCTNFAFLSVLKNEQETDRFVRIRMINFTGENR